MRQLGDAVGVEVPAAAVSDPAAVQRALQDHSAVLIRGLAFTPQDLIAFSRHFGELDEAPVNEKGRTALDGLPELYVVSNIPGPDGRPIGSLGAGEASWHTDMSYLETPPEASMLYALEVPAEGGDTWIAGMAAALDRLPDALRKALEGRRIKHDGVYNSAGLLRQGAREESDPAKAAGAFHPAICRHPVTGREGLFLGRRRGAWVEGLPAAASDALLDQVWAEATRDEVVYAHRWRVGDLLIWDNRMTLHRRDPFDPVARRLMHRTQIRGSGPPVAA